MTWLSTMFTLFDFLFVILF